MIRVWHAGRGVWTAVVVPRTPLRVVGRARRAVDTRAALRARAYALGMARRDVQDCSRISLSHSAGAGAAIVAPPRWTVGVDIMPLGRVGTRHAAAILSDNDIDALEDIEPTVAPTVAWTIKEAAAKASGRAAALSLSEFRIRACSTDGHLVVDVPTDPPTRLEGRWTAVGAFVCAWAIAGCG